MTLDLNLPKKKKDFDVTLCLLCQDKNNSTFVSNPKETSINNIRKSSERRRDNIIEILDNEDYKKTCKWHRNCYASYISEQNVVKCERRFEADSCRQPHIEIGDINTTPSSSSTLITRSIVPKCDFKKCIFCQNISKKGVKKTFRFSEQEPAKRLLKVCKEKQDQVFVRLSNCADENDVFAADVLYHKLCLLEYFRDKDKNELPNDEVQQSNTQLHEAFELLVLEINEELNSKGFEVSYLTKRLRQLFNGDGSVIDNRLTKRLLIKHYGETLLFSHPSDQSKSPIVFNTNMKLHEIVENVRHISKTTINAESLRNEVKNKSFELDKFLSNESSINEAFENFKFSPTWESFFRQVVGKGRTITDDLRRKCISIYMDLHYLISDGNLTPKHVSLAQCIHHYTRSRFLITLLNKLGHSVSYSTLTKLDDQVLTNVVESSSDKMPVPSNIVPHSNLFIHGAIDNDDFNEESYDGKDTTHVTAMVLYQPMGVHNDQLILNRKIPIPKNITKVSEVLECQTLKCSPPINRKLEYYPDTIELNSANSSNTDHLIWVLSRLNVDSVGEKLILPKLALSPGWTPFNQVISTTDIPMTNIGFCPLVPAPPTTTDCLYTVMGNFVKLNNQLGQEYSVLSCDMAVYLLAKLVQTQTNGFGRLYLRIGTFHLAKNWLSIIGQYMLDSGFSDILIETEMYGENTVKSILRGAQYNRGIRTHKLMYEACRRLQLRRFFDEVYDFTDFDETKRLVKLLQEATMSNDNDASAVFELIKEEHFSIFEKFSSFLKESSEKNETFKYWNQYCEMVEVLLDCIKADRDGNWDLHISSVKRMVPYFLIFNHYNYARGCILYLDDMSRLPADILHAFKNGLFSVKRQQGTFNAVASDHALEQSLIRSSKVQGGLIGITSNEVAMRKWCLLYHQKAEVTDAILKFCEMTQDPNGDVCKLHKEWNSSRITKDEKDVQTLINFFCDHDDPFLDSSLTLRNVVSGTAATQEAALFLLNLTDIKNNKYEQFKNDRMINKLKSLYAPLVREKVFSFNSTDKEEKNISKKTNQCVLNISQTVLLATQRGFNMKELMSHELAPFPPSISLENGHLKKSVKSDLLHAIEKDCECSGNFEDIRSLPNQVHIFDGMALIHGIPSGLISKLKCFGDLAAYQLSRIEKALQQTNTDRVDVVYDIYDDSSMKNVEHEIRTGGKSPLIVNIHDDSTKLPSQWPRYLSHNENKRKLVEYMSKYLLNKIHIPNGKILYFSGCFRDPTLCYCKDNQQTIKEVLALKSNHVEADTRMYLHVQHCLKADRVVNKHVIIHSPDTDVFVLGVRFWNIFKQSGCLGLWLIVGVGAKKRSLSCHLAAEALGSRFCEVLPALHSFTGCDTTSKIGTKNAAYKYAKSNIEVLDILSLLCQRQPSEDTMSKLEALYLCLLRKKADNCNESRFIQLTTNPSVVDDISKMTCTSDCFQLHVLRCAAQIYYWENSLNAEVEPLDLLEYGYYKDSSGKLRPLLMRLPPIPSSLLKPCNCKNCSKTTCGCFSNNSPCCSYCKCYDNCKNSLNKVSYFAENTEVEEEDL